MPLRVSPKAESEGKHARLNPGFFRKATRRRSPRAASTTRRGHASCTSATYRSVEAGDEFPYLPRHQLYAMVGVEVGRFEGYGSMNYVAATREEAGSEPLDEVMATDPLLNFHAGVSVRIVGNVKLYLNGRNLGDQRVVASHRPYGARPNAPRWMQSGVKAEF